MFIKLTWIDDEDDSERTTWVNTAFVVDFFEYYGSQIYMSYGPDLHVRETPEELLDLLAGTQK